MDEELNSIQLDRPRFGKSKEQLAKHTIDAQFDTKPIEKSLHLLRKGDDVQKLSVIQALPRLLQYDASATLTRVLPRIQQELPKSSCEFHIATSKVFRFLIESKAPLNLLNTVLQGCESKDPIVTNAWTETLLAVIPLLPLDQIKMSVLPLAISKAQLNNPVYGRVASCKILGQVAVHPSMTPLDVKTVILPLVQSLAQDCFQDVRAAMCAQLPLIAQGLGEDFVRSNLLPSLVELASDDNMNVRGSAVAAVALIIPYLTKPKAAVSRGSGAGVEPNIDTDTVVPLIRRLCERSLDEGDTTYPAVARELGRILDSLRSNLDVSDCVWFLNFYKTLSAKGRTQPVGRGGKAKAVIDINQAVMCREQCAFNLPAVTLFMISRIAAQLEVWHLVFSELAVDSCYMVRKTVAGCVHEIAKILGPHCKIIKDDVVKILRDDAEEVLHMIVPNVGAILEFFCTYGVLSRDVTLQATLELARALLKCHSELSKHYNWRMQTTFLEQLEHLPHCIPSDFIHQHFTPVLLTCVLEARPKPIRSQATRTLLVFLRYNTKENHRKWIRDNLISSLCDSKSCYTRDLFIRMCVHAMEIFSNSYFKKYFFEPLLQLADDPVSNVRYCLVKLLPNLSRMLTTQHEDKTLVAAFDTVCQKLDLMEKDKDVRSLLKIKMRESKSVSNASRQEGLAEEKRKLEEENRILSEKHVAGVANVANGVRPTSRRLSGGPNDDTTSNVGQKAPIIVRSTSAPPRGASNMSSSRPASSVSTRPVSLSPYSSTVRCSSELSFLEQHFYIDAGVTLPRETLNKVASSSSSKSIVAVDRNDKNKSKSPSSTSGSTITIESVSLAQLEHQMEHKLSLVDANKNIVPSVASLDEETLTIDCVEAATMSTTNMTDDVKVNLRKSQVTTATTAKSRLAPRKSGNAATLQDGAAANNNRSLGNGGNLRQPKRYSSVYSSVCLESPKKKTLNRRSLNFAGSNASPGHNLSNSGGGGDNSKIPVLFGKKSQENKDRGDCNNTTSSLGLKDIGIRPKPRPKSDVISASLNDTNNYDFKSTVLIGGAVKKTSSPLVTARNNDHNNSQSGNNYNKPRPKSDVISVSSNDANVSQSENDYADDNLKSTLLIGGAVKRASSPLVTARNNDHNNSRSENNYYKPRPKSDVISVSSTNVSQSENDYVDTNLKSTLLIGGAVKRPSSPLVTAKNDDRNNRSSVLLNRSNNIEVVKETVPRVIDNDGGLKMTMNDVPIKCSIKEMGNPRASGLPVFKRRAQSEMRR